MRAIARFLLCSLLAAVLLPSLSASPASAERLGPGRPSSPGFSGYTTRAGHELGIARLADGRYGICLDTGTRRWPDRGGRARTVTHPEVGYLLSVHLERARRDGVLAVALWWVVGRLQGLNAEPRRMAARMAELRRESPRVLTAVVARARALLREAGRYAPPATGAVPARPVLETDGRTGTLSGLGVRSRSGQWLPGLGVRVTLAGATFADGTTSHTFRSTASPTMLGWRRDGASAVSVSVRYTGVPAHQYLLFRPGARFQRVASSASRRTLTTSVATPALSAPRLSTQVNRRSAVVGQVLVDAVRVDDTRGVPHEGEWKLLGPVTPDRDLRCRRVRWAAAPVAGAGTFTTAGDGTVDVGRTRLRRGGCYTYRERLIPSVRSTGTPWTRAGLVEETSLVRPRQPVVPDHPRVDTGARWSAGTRTPAPQHRARVVVPSGRIYAGLSAVAFRGATLPAPHRRSSAGIWTGSVPLSSLVGTTLLAGHVSDSRDRPGAFHGLRRVRVGERITTTDTTGTVRHWRVVRVGTVDRRRLPASLFQQGVARRLVLVTCTDRIVRPGGGFHYRRNLVVQAVPW